MYMSHILGEIEINIFDKFQTIATQSGILFCLPLPGGLSEARRFQIDCGILISDYKICRFYLLPQLLRKVKLQCLTLNHEYLFFTLFHILHT